MKKFSVSIYIRGEISSRPHRESYKVFPAVFSSFFYYPDLHYTREYKKYCVI